MTRATGTWFIRSGNNIATSNLLDGVFADGTQIDLTQGMVRGSRV